MKNFLYLALSIVLFAACTSQKENAARHSATEIVDSREGTVWQHETFSQLQAEGIVHLVVFIRDSTAIHIDGCPVTQGDPRITITHDMLTVAAPDSLPEHRIHEVRIYTPNLTSYRINNCGEANISGDAVVASHFNLDINNCNIFRGNAVIRADHADISLNHMLMAKLKFAKSSVSLNANNLQYVELKGTTTSLSIEGNAKDKVQRYNR